MQFEEQEVTIDGGEMKKLTNAPISSIIAIALQETYIQVNPSNKYSIVFTDSSCQFADIYEYEQA